MPPPSSAEPPSSSSPTGRVQTITSRDNPLVRRIRRLLAKPAEYRQAGEVWLEGDHLVRAYLDRSGRVQSGGTTLQAVITEAAWHGRADLRALAQRAGSVGVVPPALMAQLSALDSPAELGLLVPWADLAGTAVRADRACVVLDRLQDPGNVGSILRSAAALGVAQVVALQGTVALGSPKVLRAGMGAHFALSLLEGWGVQDLLAAGLNLVVTSSHEAQDLGEAVLPHPCAWVFGHEGRGVQEELMQAAAARVRIPQPGGQESLNVAAAAAICLYEGSRREGSRRRGQ